MANPQIEDGHTDIANEIVEALARTRISGEEMQCLWVIFRKTYGWHKKEDDIALTQFCMFTGINKGNVCRAIGKLLSKKIITVIKKDNGISSYGINKDFDTWEPLSKKTTLSKMTKLIIKKDNKTLSKKTPTKETTKENKEKEYVQKELGIQKSKIVTEIFDYWKSVMDHPRASLDTNRKNKIEKRLAEGRTVEECKKAIDGCKASPYHQGVNDRNQVYDDIELIFRDAKHFEQFLNIKEPDDPYKDFPILGGAHESRS